MSEWMLWIRSEFDLSVANCSLITTNWFMHTLKQITWTNQPYLPLSRSPEPTLPTLKQITWTNQPYLLLYRSPEPTNPIYPYTDHLNQPTLPTLVSLLLFLLLYQNTCKTSFFHNAIEFKLFDQIRESQKCSFLSGPATKKKILFWSSNKNFREKMWPISSRGGAKALVARSLKENFFAASLSKLDLVIKIKLLH